VAAPLLVLLLFAGPPWAFFALALAASGISAAELFAMTHRGDRVSQSVGIASTLAVAAIVYLWPGDARALLSLVLVVPIVGMLTTLFRLGAIESAALRLMTGAAGPFYVGALLATLAVLRQGPGPGFVLLAMTIAWLGDTGGYFVGRYLGKTKLYEAVSPKKTRAGFVGSLLGSVLAGLVAHFWYLPELGLSHGVLLGLIAGALGQAGDLIESLLKRSTGVKDSGWILPGHGGLLDRIDALLVVSPCVYLYTLWVPA
jgi:phosphatidate cytidylyltransferase